jgi:hypothetical protein
MTMSNRELLEAIVRNGKQGLCGPLGYNEREELKLTVREAEQELAALGQVEPPSNECPYCSRIMSNRERDEQRACSDCLGS